MKRQVILTITLLFLFISNVIFSQSNDLQTNIDIYMNRAEQNGFNGTVFLAKDNEIVYNKGFGWADREAKIKETDQTIFNLGSITKQFTGAAILKLGSENKLSTNDNLKKYFPNLREDKAKITLHQLLTHTSGLTHALGEDDVLINATDYMSVVDTSTLKFQPGEKYRYSNVGYSILGIIVEQLSGKSYEEYLSENFFKPLGMNNTGYQLPKFDKDNIAVGYKTGVRWGKESDRPTYPDGPGWHLRANGGILSNSDDMYKWYKGIRNGTILPSEQVKKFIAPHVPEGEDASTFYAYGWVVEPKGNDTIVWHNGGNSVFNAFVGFDLKNDIMFVASSNTDDKISDDYAYRIMGLMTGEFVPMSDQKIYNLSGEYFTKDNVSFKIRFDENNNVVAVMKDPAEVILLSSEAGLKNAAAETSAGNKSLELINDLFADRYESLAKAYEVTTERAKYWNDHYFGDIKKTFGTLNEVKLLGTVSRKNDVSISFTELMFDNENFYATLGWKGDELVAFYVDPELTKRFGYKNDNEYYSGSTKMTLNFIEAENAQPKLRITQSDGSVIEAVKG